MANNITIWPPDTFCFLARQAFQADEFYCSSPDNFTVTQNMLNFLNLTSDAGLYRQAYCVNPASDDSCPFGYCPNGDIAGPLVRIASYITNLCLSILIFYSPKSAEDAFWSQVLSIYSLLITCVVSIFQTSLTRFHAAIATVITGSPLSFYLFIYCVASFWYKKHRLNGIVGEGHLAARSLILIAGVVWVCLLVYILVPTHFSDFSQESCETQLIPLANYLYVFPFRVLPFLRTEVPSLLVLVVGFLSLTVISWIVAILLQRKTIWPPGEKWSPHFGRTWSVIGRNYSFLHFVSIVVIPTAYWISVVEIGCGVALNDLEFSLSFGQVMAMFVALPPLLSTLRLYKVFFNWLKDLAWVRRLSGRPRKRSLEDHTALSGAAAPTGRHDDGDDDWKSELETNDYASPPKLLVHEPSYDYSRVAKDGY
ncbi:unnamed protein product [Somion occarium]|uniref:Uncharacterized protein n=1 Tax=Somion occarium TaxID=3059160 RepID=A0ABP1DM58_9APHY